MASLREALEHLQKPCESFDPADVDALQDDTAVGSRGKKRKLKIDAPQDDNAVLPSGRGRLRLRADIPEHPKYKGKRVSRKSVFADGDDSDAPSGGAIGSDKGVIDESDDGSEEDNVISSAAAGGLSIPADLEKEYNKFMQETHTDLEVMRTPSAADLAKRQASSQRLKQSMQAWSTLVEMRINLEGALNLGHRLPGHSTRGAFHAADPAVATEEEAVGADIRSITGTLSALQQQLLASSRLPIPRPSGGTSNEAAAWEALDAQMKPVLEWALDVADDWKERTRLDVRKSFSVLDQSMSAQMRSVAETPQEKIRQRCTPVPGRHSVIGEVVANAENDPPSEGLQANVVGQTSNGGAHADIYDDHEFYVQLLREVLAGGGAAASEAREQHAELRGRRATKKQARENVERRASKGRKIRYVPIERLQNFMAPRPRESFSENGGTVALDASLFGGATAEALMQSLFAKQRTA